MLKGWTISTAGKPSIAEIFPLPKSPEENERIMEGYAGNYGWLNAQQVEVNGELVWQDASGANLTYTNWRSSVARSGKNCAFMKQKGQWLQGVCENKNRATLCV